MRVIDLFSGVGGFSIGFKLAGDYEIVLANEIDRTIADSYKKNHPETIMINEDIKNLSQYIIDIGKIDVIIGGPPCQGFSMAGKRIREKYKFLDDNRNYLFRWYFETVKILEPTFFVMENVVGLTSMNNGDILKEIINIFTNSDNFNNGKYYVYPMIFDASEYGVPQERKRFILLGCKYDVDFGKYLDFVKSQMISDGEIIETNIMDAISDLNFLKSGEGKFEQAYKFPPQSKYQKYLRYNSKMLYNHIATNHNKIAIDRMSRLKPGENRHNLAEGQNIKSVHSGSYGRMAWKNKAKTIITRFDTPSSGEYIHPEIDRTITPREAARLQSFPDSVIFYGHKSSVIKQIGNAVPPLLAKYIGRVILKIKEDFQ